MFLKIVQDHGQSDQISRQTTIECKYYETIYHPSPTQTPLPPVNYCIRPDVIYAFLDDYDEDGVPIGACDTHIFYELWAYPDKKEPVQVLLHNAIVFVMNNNGKTIDKMYT